MDVGSSLYLGSIPGPLLYIRSKVAIKWQRNPLTLSMSSSLTIASIAVRISLVMGERCLLKITGHGETGYERKKKNVSNRITLRFNVWQYLLLSLLMIWQVGMRPALRIQELSGEGTSHMAIFKCGWCGFEGPCYGTLIIPPGKVTAPECRKCGRNDKLTPVSTVPTIALDSNTQEVLVSRSSAMSSGLAARLVDRLFSSRTPQ